MKNITQKYEINNPLSFLEKLAKQLKNDLEIKKTGNVVITCEKNDSKYGIGHKVFYNHVLFFDDNNNSYFMEFYFNDKLELLNFTTDGFNLFTGHSLRVNESIVVLKRINDFFKEFKSHTSVLEYNKCKDEVFG